MADKAARLDPPRAKRTQSKKKRSSTQRSSEAVPEVGATKTRETRTLPRRLETLARLWYVEHALLGLAILFAAAGAARVYGIVYAFSGIAFTYLAGRGLRTRTTLLRELLVVGSVFGLVGAIATFGLGLVELKLVPVSLSVGLAIPLCAYSIRTLTHPEVRDACGKRRRVETWGEMVTETYFSIDRRTLGLTRILLGVFLIGDLFRRTHDWLNMFGNSGVLPTELILTRPQANGFSLLHGFANNWELYALWGVIFVTYVCVLVGYKTKPAQILSLIFVASMNGRVLLIENGGYVVHSLVLLWTCFMPLGDRFSVDAMLTSLKRKRETTPEELNDRRGDLEPFRLTMFKSLVPLVVLLQLSALYYFNKVHKYGPAWSFMSSPFYPDQGPRAVHFVMYADRMVNPLPADFRTHVPFFVYGLMTQVILGVEMLLAYLLLTPVAKVWSRRIACVFVNFLHIGFGSTFTLGPFAWALCVFSTLLFQREDWELVNKVIVREHRRRTVLFDPTSGAALFFCRIAKRLDRYALLGFDTLGEDERQDAIAVERMDGTRVTGRQALAEIVAAFPVGAFFAPLFTWSFGRRFALGFGLFALIAVGVSLPHASVQVWSTPWHKVWPWQIETGLIVGLVVGLPVVVSGDVAGWVMQRGRWSRFFKLDTAGDIPAIDRTAAPARKVFVWWRGFGRELMIGAMATAALNQALTELWSTRDWWSKSIASLNETAFAKTHFDTPFTVQDKYMQPLAHELRFLQGWFMFSPNPVMDDGTIVVDAVTADGRHIDPFWGIAPDFDLLHSKSYGYNQIWSDYFNRIHTNRTYWDAMVDYMRGLPERTGDPRDKIVSGEVYWTHCWNPKWGTTESYGFSRELMFTFDEDGGAKTPPPPAPPPQPPIAAMPSPAGPMPAPLRVPLAP